MEKRKLNRRDFLRFSAAAATGAVIASCAPATPQVITERVVETVVVEKEVPVEKEVAKEVIKEVPVEKVVEKVVKETVVVEAAPKPAEKATVEFWWGWTPEIHVSAITAAVNQFTEKNPHITVKTATADNRKKTAAMAGGVPPDLMQSMRVPEWAAMGTLTPLDDYIDSSDVITWDKFWDASWVQGQWAGRQFSIPALEHHAQWGSYVNTALAAEVGMKLPDDMPKTWDQAWEQCVKWTTLDESGNITRLWGELSSTSTWVLTAWGEGMGIAPYDPNTMAFSFDDERWEAPVNFMARYWQEWGPEKIEAFYETYPGWAAAAGNAKAMGTVAYDWLEGYWSVGELAKTAPDKTFYWDYIPVSSEMEGLKLQQLGSHMVVIPREADQKDAAWELAEHLTTIEAIRVIFNGCGFLNSTMEVLESPASVVDFEVYPGLKFYFDSIVEADKVIPYTPCPIASFLGQSWTQCVNAVIYEEKTTEEALADLQKAVTDEINTKIEQWTMS